MPIITTIHTRREEIQRLVSSQNLVQAVKRLMDYALDFSEDLGHVEAVMELEYPETPLDRANLKTSVETLLEAITQNYEQRKHPVQSSVTIDAPTVFSCWEMGKRFKRSSFHLEDINLDLYLGEITSVVGENGNGKTTLFRLVVGEISADEGHLEYPLLSLDENELDWFDIKKQIAYVPQDLPKWYGSLKSNIQYAAAIHGLKGTDNQREVDFIIRRLGLENHLTKRWKELSGGYKLRFALAKALVTKPKLLVIDEPLANLDFKAQQIILSDLRNLSRSLKHPVAILLSSQHLHEIESVTDNIRIRSKWAGNK